MGGATGRLAEVGGRAEFLEGVGVPVTVLVLLEVVPDFTVKQTNICTTQNISLDSILQNLAGHHFGVPDFIVKQTDIRTTQNISLDSICYKNLRSCIKDAISGSKLIHIFTYIVRKPLWIFLWSQYAHNRLYNTGMEYMLE